MRDLKVEVTEIKFQCGARHQVGDTFYIKGKGRVVIPDGRGICVYAMSSLLPFLMLKQREDGGGDDWVPHVDELSCPDAQGVVFKITQV